MLKQVVWNRIWLQLMIRMISLHSPFIKGTPNRNNNIITSHNPCICISLRSHHNLRKRDFFLTLIKRLGLLLVSWFLSHSLWVKLCSLWLFGRLKDQVASSLVIPCLKSSCTRLRGWVGPPHHLFCSNHVSPSTVIKHLWVVKTVCIFDADWARLRIPKHGFFTTPFIWRNTWWKNPL